MDKRRPRFVPGASFATECLEGRVVLSAVGSGRAAEIAQAARKAATKTTLQVMAGTLGQPVVFTVTVRAAASAGSPTGTVEIVDHGKILGTVTLAPMASTNGRYAYSGVTATMTQIPGAGAYYFGKHQASAVFIPNGAFAKSTAGASFSVSQPNYSTLAGGVKASSTARGSGPAIQSGQTAHVLYTGYLAKTGQIFDDSVNDGGTPFSFTLGAGQVVPGFDIGMAGMQAGETRVIQIPPAEGYGATPNGPIPANSTLIFVVTLQSIS
jgi:FKBP-type peptidyl-prolyl cis-trans isomerase